VEVNARGKVEGFLSTLVVLKAVVALLETDLGLTRNIVAKVVHDSVSISGVDFPLERLLILRVD